MSDDDGFKFLMNDVDNKFFKALKECKKVTYKWGYDELTCNGHSMSGDEFIELAEVSALTAADVCFILLYNGIEVEITDYMGTFKNGKEEVDEFLEKLKAEVVRLALQN